MWQDLPLQICICGCRLVQEKKKGWREKNSVRLTGGKGERKGDFNKKERKRRNRKKNKRGKGKQKEDKKVPKVQKRKVKNTRKEEGKEQKAATDYNIS